MKTGYAEKFFWGQNVGDRERKTLQVIERYIEMGHMWGGGLVFLFAAHERKRLGRENRVTIAILKREPRYYYKEYFWSYVLGVRSPMESATVHSLHQCLHIVLQSWDWFIRRNNKERRLSGSRTICSDWFFISVSRRGGWLGNVTSLREYKKS